VTGTFYIFSIKKQTDKPVVSCASFVSWFKQSEVQKCQSYENLIKLASYSTWGVIFVQQCLTLCFFCQRAVILGGLIAIGFALALQDHSATHLARTEKT